MSSSQQKHPSRILIVGPSWVGDMVMAQSLFIQLKQLHPEALIDVLAPAWSRPLLERMPEVHASIEMPVGHGKLDLGKRRRLGHWLRQHNYDQAILLPNSLKSALVPFFAGIPLRTGWRGEMRYGLLNDIRLLNKQRYPLMVQRFVALALPPGAALPEALPRPALVAQDRFEALAQEFGLNRERPVLALCPGAEFGPAKRWPEAHYAEVAASKIAEGWQVWLLGSGKDRDVCADIIERQSDEARSYCENLAGRTQLADAIDLLAQADAVVSNDSGLMHIAAALGRPLAVVYGSTSPDFTPPLAEKVRILSIEVECGPCFQRECPLGHMKCLQELPPQRALDALDELCSDAGEATRA
ncbi:lipopolysaccharide heptosyltransferase II [Biformimicrobium ophioploci]|uniref:lipopolysaccharide heptosyltransferase II n=1 Tax=Biformimicrobium ophioploci TaxID=3036711 RepID=A0ABQ6M0M6_9GAMM|nr:lipopolysaccharide heptosyltransferase II [Microbulbifer sp. NKW57]GMG87876.1 lipopolysaccharide heptosyltransferase II [Microbulbifer sp. NKW57]